VQFLEKTMPKRKRLSAQPKSTNRLGSNPRRQERGSDRHRKQHPSESNPQMEKASLEDFAQLFEDDRKGERAREAEHEKQINELYAEIGRLSAQLSWLKKKSGFKFE
jgi:transposase